MSTTQPPFSYSPIVRQIALALLFAALLLLPSHITNAQTKTTLRGTVVDEQGVPVARVAVVLYNYEDGEWRQYDIWYTDKEGRFQFEDIPKELYRLRFSANYIISEFYRDQTSLSKATKLDLTDGSPEVDVDVVVTRHGHMTGTITNLRGELLPYMYIERYTLYEAGWYRSRDDLADDTGTYVAYGVPGYEHRYKIIDTTRTYVDEYYDDTEIFGEAQVVTLPIGTKISDMNVVLRRPSEVEAGFSGEPRIGIGSVTTDFVNQAKGDVITQTWDFGDGMTSTEISPTHTYTQAGVYTVTLTVAGLENRHTKTASGYISVTDVPVMDLAIEMDEQVGSPDAPASVGETLHFSASAGGTGVQYLWDFGDESALVASVATTATGQYVQHAYDAAGTYTVTLTASNSEGEQSTTHAVTVVGVASEESTLLLPKLER